LIKRNERLCLSAIVAYLLAAGATGKTSLYGKSQVRWNLTIGDEREHACHRLAMSYWSGAMEDRWCAVSSVVGKEQYEARVSRGLVVIVGSG
jgi:hypothetical protein